MTFERETLELLCFACFGGAIAILPLVLILVNPKRITSDRIVPSWSWLRFCAGVVVAVVASVDLLLSDTFITTNIVVTPVRIAVVALLTMPILTIFLSPKPHRLPITCGVLVLIFSIAALILNFSSAPYTPVTGNSLGLQFFRGGWYHWGAYLASAKSLAAGLAIYHDFPSQYGLGPSLLIVAVSSIGWAAGMFYVFGVLQFLFWAGLTSAALLIARRAVGYNPLIWFGVLTAMLATCFFWAGSPSFANFYPSLGGGRYLPVVALATAIILMDLTPLNYAEKRGWLLHIVWAIGALWSIESLFMVSFVWWPQYILLRTRAGTTSSITVNYLRSALVLLGVGMLTLVLFLLAYFMIYDVLPSRRMIFAFVVNPPGPLPINLLGPILFVSCSLALSVYTLVAIYRKTGVDREFRTLLCVTLLSYGGMVYYIGRSHDSNILSLFPYHALILIFLFLNSSAQFIRAFAASTLGLWISFAMVGQYGSKMNRYDNILTFNGGSLDKVIIDYFENPETTDRGRAIDYITKTYGEGITAFDEFANVVVTRPQNEWTAYISTTTFYGLPTGVQKLAIHRSKLRLMRKGWVVLPTENPPQGLPYVLDLFSADYDLIETKQLASYVGYRFAPKP